MMAVPAVVAGLINIIPGIANTILSIGREKKKSTSETESLLPAFVEDNHNIAKGLELSSKTCIGYGAGGVIIMWAMAIGDPLHSMIGVGIGALTVVGVTLAKALERDE